jgi:hypothetical protein
LYRPRSIFVLLPVLLLARVAAPATCLTTLPQSPAFTPPAPYPADASGGFWYGSEALWTRLPLQGNWATAGVMQKFFVFSKNFDWRTARQPLLIVTGKRIDGDAPPVAVAGGTNAGATGWKAMLVGFEIPTGGCWEINAWHDGHVLTFVVLVGAN